MSELHFNGTLTATDEDRIVAAIAPMFGGKVRRKADINFVDDTVDIAIYPDGDGGNFLISAVAQGDLAAVRPIVTRLASALDKAGIEFVIDIAREDNTDERFSNGNLGGTAL